MNNTSIPKLLIFLATTFLLFSCSEDGVLTPQSGGTGIASVDTLIGSGTGSNFTEGELEIKLDTVETFGSTVVSAYIVDGSSNLSTQSHTVTFTSDCAVQLLASFSATSVTTTTGIATTTYIDQGCQLNDSINASITVDSVTKTASGSVTINSSGTPTITTVRIGTGSGTSFSNGVLSIAPSAISATGTSAISANLVDDAGTLLTTAQTVTFGSTCVDSLLANLSASIVSTSNGTASTTYTAAGCTNTDTLTASVTANGTTITATGTLTIAQPSAGSIQFTSAASSLIALQGTGSTSGLPETSNIIFTVLDSIGTPVSGEDVTFSLDSNVGGISLATTTATSNSSGEVVATVQSGTVATSVRVTAVLDSNTALATTSSAIVIATGPPDQDSMSLSASILNPRAWDLDGQAVDITIRLADRFNNLIQDGTSISFVTELGAIDPSCSTVNGECVVEWRSQSPRDNANVTDNFGRTTILATVEGEESFDDTNSNGVFDDNDLGFMDMEEAFLDENEDGLYNALAANDEFYIDFNSSGTHNAANNLYNGAGCTHTSLCDTASESITVRDSLVLVMAEDEPDIYSVSTNLGSECTSQAHCVTNYPSVFNLGGDGVSSATFTISGLQNGQVLPIGTKVNFGVTNGKITAGSSHTVANTTTADTSFTVYLGPDTTPSSAGALSIEVVIGQGGGTFNLPPISLTDYAPLRVGTGSGAFIEGELSVTNGNPEADVDTVTVTAKIVDINGDPILTKRSIIFSSDCSTASPATATFSDAYEFTSTSTGIATTTYTPLAGCAGEDTITAKVNGTDPEQTATTTVYVK